MKNEAVMMVHVISRHRYTPKYHKYPQNPFHFPKTPKPISVIPPNSPFRQSKSVRFSSSPFTAHFTALRFTSQPTMAPQTRRMTAPKILFERDSDSDEENSSSSDEENEDETVADEAADEEEEAGVVEAVAAAEEEVEAKKKEKSHITISLKKVCKVCKRTGHQAGFQGATYIDCPMKPCFLCKLPGHTTMTSSSVSMERGVHPAPPRNPRYSVHYVFNRQIKPNVPVIKPAYIIPDVVDCGVIRYHSRRVTCLEFHPTNNNILLSGDKKGQLGIWDFNKVSEKTVYGNVHGCILNNMRFGSVNNGTVYAASSDGTVSYTDIETGISEPLINLNTDGWQGPSSWRMLYGLDVNAEKGLVLAADSFGFLYMLDARTNSQTGESIRIHKKGSKVTGIHCNPIHPELLLSCGNDHFARIWDIRRLESGSSLYDLQHRRVVNSAYFSPQTGSKIVTTAQDNRIRVWDSIFGNLNSPSREIVHSHDFNRHLTPFRAEWDPKDPSESLVVIGRYISENYNGVALHPIDFIDVSTGQLVAEVMDPNITTISPVNKLHPRVDLLASGSSRSLYIWKPKDKSQVVQEKEEKRILTCMQGKKKPKGKGESDDSDDDICSSKGKKRKRDESLSKLALKVKQKTFKGR